MNRMLDLLQSLSCVRIGIDVETPFPSLFVKHPFSKHLVTPQATRMEKDPLISSMPSEVLAVISHRMRVV
jgi:hypothetical protein